MSSGLQQSQAFLTIYEETDPEYPPYLKNLSSERGTQSEQFEARCAVLAGMQP